jgi:hypothetical protein
MYRLRNTSQNQILISVSGYQHSHAVFTWSQLGNSSGQNQMHISVSGHQQSHAACTWSQLRISSGRNQRLISVSAAASVSLTWHRFFSLLAA